MPTLQSRALTAFALPATGLTSILLLLCWCSLMLLLQLPEVAWWERIVACSNSILSNVETRMVEYCKQLSCPTCPSDWSFAFARPRVLAMFAGTFRRSPATPSHGHLWMLSAQHAGARPETTPLSCCCLNCLTRSPLHDLNSDSRQLSRLVDVLRPEYCVFYGCSRWPW